MKILFVLMIFVGCLSIYFAYIGKPDEAYCGLYVTSLSALAYGLSPSKEREKQ